MDNGPEQARHVGRLLRGLERREIDRREFIMLAARCSAAAIVAACAAETRAAAASPVTVPIYTPENDPGTLAFLAAAKKAYEQDHPNATISVQLISDLSSTVFLNNAFRAGHDVGIFAPVVADVPGWAEAGFLLPVDDVIKSVGPADFIPGTRMQLEGHDWWMPFQKSASGLWYRTDVLQQAGIKSLPKSYDDFVAVLKEVNGRNGMIGIATGLASAGTDALWAMHPYIQQSGWDYFSHDAKLTFDQPEVLDGVNRFVTVLRDYAGKSWANAPTTDITEAFVSGRAVFARWSGRIGPTVVDKNPKLADVTDFMGAEPGGPFMTGKLNLGFGKGYCVYSKTAAPKDALAFVQLITTGDHAVEYAATVPGQPLPALTSVTKKFLDPNNAVVKDNAFMRNPRYRGWVEKLTALVPYTTNPTAQMGAVNHAQLRQISNVNPFASQIWKTNPIDGTMVQQIVLNNQDPRTAWNSACAQMGSVADAWLKANPAWRPAA
jgi:multiple sugar transport system substrate-binding protein